MAADFQNVYRYSVCLCLSVVLADDSEHNYNLAGENELSFVVCICVFFYLHDSGFQRASGLKIQMVSSKGGPIFSKLFRLHRNYRRFWLNNCTGQRKHQDGRKQKWREDFWRESMQLENVKFCGNLIIRVGDR